MALKIKKPFKITKRNMKNEMKLKTGYVKKFVELQLKKRIVNILKRINANNTQ